MLEPVFGQHGLDLCFSAVCPSHTILIDGSVRAVHAHFSRSANVADARRKMAEVHTLRRHFELHHNKTCWSGLGLGAVPLAERSETTCLDGDASAAALRMNARMRDWRLAIWSRSPYKGELPGTYRHPWRGAAGRE